MCTNNQEKGVLFLSNVPSPYNVAFLNELGKHLPVTAVYEREFSSERDDSWKTLNVRNFECILLHGLNVSPDSAISPGVLKQLHRHRKDHIIIANPTTPTGILANFYCKLFRIPFILQSEGGFAKNGKGLKERFKYFLMHDAQMYLSGMSLKHNYFMTYGADAGRIVKYPFTSLNETDLCAEVLTAQQKRQKREELGIHAEAMALFVGQFIHRKGIDVLIKASVGLPRGTLILIVGGSPAKEYLDLIDANGITNVHFMDFVPHEELRKYYAAADVFVLPTREDIWGLVVNEAMAAGLPVITTTRCVAGEELIEDGVNGYLVEVDDAKTLHRYMDSLLRNPDVCYEMGKESRARIQAYTLENMAAVIARALTKD